MIMGRIIGGGHAVEMILPLMILLMSLILHDSDIE